MELYLHECLLRMGYSVTCHPELEGRAVGRTSWPRRTGGRSTSRRARPRPATSRVGKSARVNAVFESLDRPDSPNFFLWIDIAKQGDAPLRARPLRGRLEKWLAGLDPDDHTLVGKHRDDLPGLTHEDLGWKIDFRAVPKSPRARGREGARPLGIFGGGEAHWVQDEEGIRGALTDKGSAYGSLGAPFIVAVASSSASLDDHDVLNALYGSEVAELRTFADGTGRMSPLGHAYLWTRRPLRRRRVLLVRTPDPAA